MLTPSEIAQLRQKDREASAYAQKVFKKKPTTPPPNKSDSPETPSPISDASAYTIVEPSPRYLVPVSPKISPTKEK